MLTSNSDVVPIDIRYAMFMLCLKIIPQSL
jgi:hypothetical protein